MANNIIKDPTTVIADPGVVGTLTPINGTVNELKLVKVGSVVYLYGITRGTFPPGTYTQITTIPTDFLPNIGFTAGGATVGGRTAIVEINSAGNVSVNHQTDANRPWVGFNVSWVI